MPDSNRKHVFFLDYMRVFAFVSVLVGHQFMNSLLITANDLSIHVTLRLMAQALVPLCEGGAAGVIVFFLTSGYIITKVLQREEPGDFLLKRAFRIYPLYMLAVLLEYSCGYFIEGVTPRSLQEVVSRLFLIGDFNGTPNGLQGVEWTLRIEVLFYLFMASLKAVGLFKNRIHLPAVYAIALACLYIAPPFPDRSQWTFAYVTIYAPFLIFGSLLYLAEDIRQIRSKCIALMAVVFFAFLMLTAKLIPGWKESSYALFATVIFLTSWAFRNRISPHPLITALAELTFSVYLMHNWAWHYIDSGMRWIGAGEEQRPLQILIGLFGICFLLNRYVEKYFNGLGSRFVQLRRARKSETAMA